VSQEGTAADRFLTAWKRLEAEISSRWGDAHKGTREPDTAAMLTWAERQHLMSDAAADFLHSCRAARNAYAHVSFEGYNGPVTHRPWKWCTSWNGSWRRCGLLRSSPRSRQLP
jgi:hypothetical protein